MASLIKRGVQEKLLAVIALIKFIKGVFDLISFHIKSIYRLEHGILIEKDWSIQLTSLY